MDYQQPPEIVITHTEKHPVREEVIEHVARLLARADGVDPDADGRCEKDTSGTVTVCQISGVTGGGSDLPYVTVYPILALHAMWQKYREPAEKLLAQIFGPQPPVPGSAEYCEKYPVCQGQLFLGHVLPQRDMPPFGSFGDVAPPSEGFVPNGIDFFRDSCAIYGKQYCTMDGH